MYVRLSFFYQFSVGAPFGFSDDGLLDVRLVVSRDGKSLNYTTATNRRAPFVPLGPSDCGANTPDVLGGWCSPQSGIQAKTAYDTSGVYMASGYVPSNDGAEIFFYSSGQPFTHEPGEVPKTWGANTGIRVLRLRKHGFVSVEAQTCRRRSGGLPTSCANFTTVELTLPSGCSPPITKRVPLPAPPYRQPAGLGRCAFEFKNGVCPIADGWHNVSCTSMMQCHAVDPDKNASCAGVIQCLDGYCQSTHKLGVLCNATGPFAKTVTSGGVQLTLNVETSVSGFVAVGILQRGGTPVDEMGLQAADLIKGSSIAAAATWSGGKLGSLSALAGQKVQIIVAMSDAKLFSMELGCK